MIKIAPSILSADFSKLGEEVKALSDSGADYIHIDIMDGRYVPNISFGPAVIRSIRKTTNKLFDVHLMIDKPEKYIKEFVDVGADIITIHAESTMHLHRVIQMIKAYNIKVGVALNPATPVESIKDILNEIDMLLIMTVNPGFGGQNFLDFTLNKIKIAKSLNKNIDIEVDGGINKETAQKCIEAGANVLVAGSYIFNGNYTQKILSLKDINP